MIKGEKSLTTSIYMTVKCARGELKYVMTQLYYIDQALETDFYTTMHGIKNNYVGGVEDGYIKTSQLTFIKDIYLSCEDIFDKLTLI